MLKRLSEEQASELLRVCRVGRLGCVVDNMPYVVPVSYVYTGNNIYIHSLPGMKIQALRKNPNACLQVDEVTDPFNWRSAIAFGEYEELSDPAEHSWAVRRLLVKFPQLTPVESVPVHDGQSSVIIFAIRVKKVTGVGEW